MTLTSLGYTQENIDGEVMFHWKDKYTLHFNEYKQFWIEQHTETNYALEANDIVAIYEMIKDGVVA